MRIVARYPANYNFGMNQPWRTHPEFWRAFDSLRDPVLVADDKSRYVDANAAACDLLGYSPDELLSMSVADVVANPPAWTQAEYERYLEQRRWDGDVDLRRKDGEIVPATARARIMDMPDGGKAYVSVLKVKAASKRSI